MKIEMQAETKTRKTRRKMTPLCRTTSTAQELAMLKIINNNKQSDREGENESTRKSKKTNALKFLKAFFAQVCTYFSHLFVKTLASGPSWQRTVLHKFIFVGLLYSNTHSHAKTPVPLSVLHFCCYFFFHSSTNFCIQLMCTSALHAILFSFPKKLSLKCDVYGIILCSSNFRTGHIECRHAPVSTPHAFNLAKLCIVYCKSLRQQNHKFPKGSAP